MIGGDGVSDVLQHHRFTGFRRRHNQTALAHADRRTEVDDAGGHVLGGTVAALQAQALVRVQRGQVFKQNLVLGVFRLVVVDVINFEQREIAFAFFRRADLAENGVAGVQVEPTNLTGRDINVIGAGEVGAIARTQETKAIGQDFQHAITVNRLAILGVVFQDGENDVLLTLAGRAFEIEGHGDVGEFLGGFFLQFSQIHGRGCCHR